MGIDERGKRKVCLSILKNKKQKQKKEGMHQGDRKKGRKGEKSHFQTEQT